MDNSSISIVAQHILNLIIINFLKMLVIKNNLTYTYICKKLNDMRQSFLIDRTL